MDKETKAAIESIAKYTETNPSKIDDLLAAIGYETPLSLTLNKLKDELYFKKITLAFNKDSFLPPEDLKNLSTYYYDNLDKILAIGYRFDEFITPDSTEETSLIIDESKRIQQIVTDIYQDNTSLFTLDPRVFEELIAELLSHQGFKVELTRQTRDNGYDILAIHNINNHIPIKFLVECKRYAATRKVGVEIIRSFKEVIETEGANRGIIVTTSYFTSGAIKKQKEIPHILDLKAKDDLMNWVYDYYISKLKK